MMLWYSLRLAAVTWTARLRSMIFAMFTAALLVPCMASAAPITDSVASIRINGVLTDLTVPIVSVEGLGFLVSKSDFVKLGFTSVRPLFVIRGEEDLVALQRIAGLAVSFDSKKLELAIIAPIKLYEPKVVDATRVNSALNLTKSWGGYLNYEMTASQASQNINIPTRISGGASIEAVAFSPFGSLVHQQLLSRDGAGSTQSVRLETYFQRDFPSIDARLKIGDTVSSSGSWGRTVRLGGVRFGSDFTLRPDAVTLPGTSISTSSTVASTVDLFVNGSLQGRFAAPPGQFTIDRVPLVTGSGSVRLVVRNALGQDQIVEAPFFRVATQLAKGLSDYSVEAGALRTSFGVRNQDYADRVVIGNWRYGISDVLTGEFRGEFQQNGPRTLGAGIVFPLLDEHTFSGAAVSSRQKVGIDGANVQGWASQLGYSFSGAVLRLAARLEKQSIGFTQIGFGPTEVAVKSRATLSAGWRLSRETDFGLAYSDAIARTIARVQVLSLNASSRIDKDWILSGSASRVVADRQVSNAFSLQLNWLGDDQGIITLGAQRSADSQRANDLAFARYSQRPPLAGGYGFDVELNSQEQIKLKGELSGSAGELSAEVQLVNRTRETIARASARGAIVVTGGSILPSRVIEESFVVVSAPAAVGASVLRPGGREIKLNQDGRAVIDRVQAYQDVSISVNARDLPIEVTVDQLTSRIAVPSKAGATVQLALRKTRPIVFTLMIDGKAAQAGSTLEYLTKKIPVGLDGLVFLADATDSNAFTFTDGKRNCQFIVNAQNAAPMADLGEVQCSLK